MNDPSYDTIHRYQSTPSYYRNPSDFLYDNGDPFLSSPYTADDPLSRNVNVLSSGYPSYFNVSVPRYVFPSFSDENDPLFSSMDRSHGLCRPVSDTVENCRDYFSQASNVYIPTKPSKPHFLPEEKAQVVCRSDRPYLKSRSFYNSYPNQLLSPVSQTNVTEPSFFPTLDSPTDFSHPSSPPLNPSIEFNISHSPLSHHQTFTYDVPPPLSSSDSQTIFARPSSSSSPVLWYPQGWEKKRLTKRKSWRSLEEGKLPLGENNPNAIPGGKLCFEYMNQGRCQRMESGKVCRFRHLVPSHPDAIADRFKSGLLSEEEVRKYQLRPCEPFETNPFAPVDAKICFDFLNHHVCGRNQEMKICRFRHLLPEHPDAIRDRAKSM